MKWILSLVYPHGHLIQLTIIIISNGHQNTKHTDLSNSVAVITLRINSPILFSSISILQYESQALMFPSSRKWNNNRSKRRGIIASATAIRSFGTIEFLVWLLIPWSEQKPSAFITDVSPQSHAPPACDKNILKSCVEWSPFLKQFRHIDMHGEIPHVRHRYATTWGTQTRPHFAWLSYVRTEYSAPEKKRQQRKQKVKLDMKKICTKCRVKLIDYRWTCMEKFLC